MNVRGTGDSGQRERKAQLGEKLNAIWKEKKVFVFVCVFVTKEKKSQRGEKTMNYTERSHSEDRISQPIKPFKCLFWACRHTFVKKEKKKKMKQKEPRRKKKKKKVFALNFSASALTHPLAQQKWAPVLVVLSCVFTTSPATQAKLSTARRRGFRNGPQERRGG